MANNIKSLAFTTASNQDWVLIAAEDQSRRALFLRCTAASAADIEVSVGHEPANAYGALLLEAGVGYGFDQAAPIGPVYVRSATAAIGTLSVLEG